MTIVTGNEAEALLKAIEQRCAELEAEAATVAAQQNVNRQYLSIVCLPEHGLVTQPETAA